GAAGSVHVEIAGQEDAFAWPQTDHLFREEGIFAGADRALLDEYAVARNARSSHVFRHDGGEGAAIVVHVASADHNSPKVARSPGFYRVERPRIRSTP